MKFLRYTYTALILMATLFSFGSCEEDGTNLSQAVLASASSLNFEGSGSAPQIITVYADAEWLTEVPEWITVSPASGNGVVDVTISVSDNIRDGALDNPRRGVVVFKGATLASRAEVAVIQKGDKYRDVKNYTMKELVALADETVVSVPNVTVMAVTSAGFIVTDEQNANNVYVLDKSTVNIGDKVSILGVKSSNTQSLTIINADQTKIISTGETVTYPVATDVTDKIDTYNATSREFIVVSGILNGSNVSVAGANYSVSIIDAPSSLNLAVMNGHRVTVKGYFDGLSAPVIKVLASNIHDDGIVKNIYFFEDFEWLDPWSVVGNAGQTVETDNLSATAPQLPTPKIDGVSALDAFLQKGYNFLRVTPTSTNASECIYLQQNYLKFGKTGYQAGIILPKLAEDVPSGTTAVMLFDWCPMRQGSGVIDPVNLIVIITNGSNEVTFDVPVAGFENGRRLEWIRAEVELTGVAITKDTKITIRQTNWQLTTANRWFLDNIEISSTAN
ncbi:MAG: BACON domain-containing protein [Petrimonas sp.]|nr:BACON domain-containing protein [Petrimonas sp.]